MNIINIKKDNDPFKKYWWVILLGFAGIGAWICMPLMDTSVGSGSVRTHGLKTADQSLDSQTNPSGAPGSAYDLSMDGAGRRRADGQSTSSLYQAPPEAETGAAAPGAPLTGAGSASFADALKEVSRKTEASASWGGAKPQVPFTPPKGNFSSLSGMGGSNGSGASSGPSVSGAFGTSVAKTGMATTRGLGSGDSGAGQGGKPIMTSLKGAASQSQAALMTKSADAARAMSGASFDGSRAGSAIGGGPGTAAGGSYTGFDAVPANLKANDPNANEYKIEPIPGKYAAPAVDEGEQMRKAIMMMVISAVVGGVVTGVVGSVFGGVAGGAANSATTAAMANQIDPTHGQQTIH